MRHVLSSYLPESPQLYPDGVLTDEPEAGMIAELVRAGLIDGDAPTVGGGTLAEATAIAEACLTTAFSGDVRHARRISQVAEYETTGELPPLP